MRWSSYGCWSYSGVLCGALGDGEVQVRLSLIWITLNFMQSLFLKDLMLPCQSVCVTQLIDLPLRSTVTNEF